MSELSAADLEPVQKAIEMLDEAGFDVQGVDGVETAVGDGPTRWQLTLAGEAAPEPEPAESVQDPDDERSGQDDVGDDQPHEEGRDQPTDENDKATNPYAPDDYGVLTVGERSGGRTYICVTKVVSEHFDSDRVHVRERGGRVELAPGGHDDCPSYSNEADQPALGSPVVQMLNVIPGDEVRAIPDDDVVVLEPQRIAERDDDALVPPSYDLSDDEMAIVDTLDDEGELSGTGLKTVTGQSNSIYNRISKLEDLGLIERRKDPDDGRRSLYSLTDTVGATSAADQDDVGEPEQEPPAPAESLTDGGAATGISDTALAATCQNCGSQVTADYARVFAPDGEDDPRICPDCEDKVRDGNEVRYRRDRGQHLEDEEADST